MTHQHFLRELAKRLPAHMPNTPERREICKQWCQKLTEASEEIDRLQELQAVAYFTLQSRTEDRDSLLREKHSRPSALDYTALQMQLDSWLHSYGQLNAKHEKLVELYRELYLQHSPSPPPPEVAELFLISKPALGKTADGNHQQDQEQSNAH